MSNEPAIHARGIDVTLGGQQILFDVDLTVNSGEVVALLGANGSGKSTLVRTLLGITPHTAGRVELFGTSLGPQAPWRRIGYVPQRIPTGGGVPSTAVEVVTSGLVYGRQLRPPRNAHLRAQAALDRVGMAALAKRSVLEMSGGQQQRVLIARALIRDPDLLVMDEPTSGIDLPTQETFVNTISTLHDDGASVLVILHEQGSFGALLDRAVVLRHGRVVHDGPPPRPRAEHADPHHDHPHADPTPEPMTGLSVEVLP